jgi:integrase
MVRPIRRLSAISIKNAKPGLHPDGGNLYLQVADSGAKSWLFRFGRSGRERWMGLGPLITVGLAEAREEAIRCRGLLLKGIDPIEARKADRAQNELAQHAGTTFRDCADRLVASHEASWRNAKHRNQWRSTLATYAYPVIGPVAVQSVDTGMVLKVLEPIWQTKPETASRVRGRIEAVLDWATVRGYRSGDNPARWKGHLSEVLPSRGQIQKTQHHAALPFTELPELIVALAEREGVAARALEFTILTAARTGEIIGARWSEIDLQEKTWIVPAGRIKGGREHRVPLSDPALAVLRKLPRERGNDFVFIGPRRGGLSNMALAAVLKRMGRDVITVHGFRSTFRDWAAERTNYQNHVVEMALAHVVGEKVEAAYRRGDLFEKRRRLMAEWAKFCASTPIKNEDDNVVALARSRS